MKKILIPISLILMTFPSCHHEDPEHPPGGTPSSVAHDVTAGLETALMMSEAAPPVTPVQAAAYALVGTIVGMIASGYADKQAHNWPGESYNLDIEVINQQALNTYTPGETQYAGLGEIHNRFLHEWATTHSPAAPFGVNEETINFTSEFLNNSGLAQEYKAGYPELEYSIATLVQAGVDNASVPLNNISELNTYLDSKIEQHPPLEPALTLTRAILQTTWTYMEENNYEAATNYIKDQVYKINRNYYDFNMINFSTSIAMANILVYSYHYWKAYFNE